MSDHHKERATKRVKFCPLCGGPLEEHYNIDINDVDGLRCRKDYLFIEINTCLVMDPIGFRFEVSGIEE
jgi:hypothetical protein